MKNITSNCKKCGSEFSYIPKQGYFKLFCSRKCANSRVQTKETNKERSNKLKGRKATGGQTIKNRIQEEHFTLYKTIPRSSLEEEVKKGICHLYRYVKQNYNVKSKGTFLRFCEIEKIYVSQKRSTPNSQIFCENSFSSIVRQRVLADNLLAYECSICKNNGFWNDKELTLQLDHINGIRSDNRLENLRFLCPNCHSQTVTFGTKNLQNVRKRIPIFSDEHLELLRLRKVTPNYILRLNGLIGHGSHFSSLSRQLIEYIQRISET